VFRGPGFCIQGFIGYRLLAAGDLLQADLKYLTDFSQKPETSSQWPKDRTPEPLNVEPLNLLISSVYHLNNNQRDIILGFLTLPMFR
jgi:hypothetical protein